MNIDEIAQALSNMSQEEIQLLANVLENNYGISADTYPYPVGIVGPLEAPVMQGKTGYDVILMSHGNKKLMVVKTIKEVFGLGLREAKHLADEAPQLLEANISKERAERIRELFVGTGATIRIE